MAESDFSHYPEYQVMMRKITKHNSVRLISAAVLLFLNVPVALIPLTNQYGLGFTIFALLYLAGILVSFAFAVPETLKLCAIPAFLILLGIISECIFWGFGFLLLLLLVWVIPDYKKLEFLKKQEGYPQFNERFEKQSEQFMKEYQSEYSFDIPENIEMKDAFEEMPAEISSNTAQHVQMPDAFELSERSDFYAD